MKPLSLLLVLIILFSFQTARAQQQSPRPKIGLTLSGGGAKGLAHIGILQAIDSAGLKIDYITGTSMGSVVGGLYAAGYSGDSIEVLAKSLDWELLFSSSPQLDQISIEEKSEYNSYALTVPIEKKKLKLGTGIIEGQELWLKLSELFHPVYDITDFSKLPIPFKCIGTDLETGNAVAMDHGNIVTAIRASMAIPSVFTPVQYENKLLVDGGIVNNFPVLDVKEMGADYVIGVNLNQGLSKAQQLNTSIDIIMQIVFFKDAAFFDQHKAKCDLFILPELKGYETADFAFSDSIIDCGKETGNLYYPYFKRMADSLNNIYGENGFVKDRLPKNKQININKFSVDGLKNTKENFFFGLLNLKTNKNYTDEQLNEAIHRVYGSRYYDIIRYSFVADQNGATEMHFAVEESPLSAVKFGINYNDFTKLGLKFNLTSRELLFKESRAMVSVQISENPRLYAEYFKYINKPRTTRALIDFYYEFVDFPVYNDFRLFQTLRSTYSAYDAQLQHNINRNSYLGLGQQFIQSKIKTEETPSLIYNGNNNYWYSYLSYRLNNVDQKYFATKGWDISAEVGYVFSQNPEFEYSYSDSSVSSDSGDYNYDDYFKIYINAIHYSKLNSKFSWSQQITLAYIIEENPYLANNFVVGGVNEIIRNQITFVGT